MKKPLLLLILSFSGSTWLSGQVDSIDRVLPALQEVIEDFLQNTDSEGDFDFNTIFEDLETYIISPLDLNQAEESQLQDLRLLTDNQVNNLLNYRRRRGALISLYELQAVPGFDLQTIRRILPFVSVKTTTDDYQLSIPRMLAEGKNEFFLRWSRILEQQKGYQPLAEGETASRYIGDPNQVYFRYKHSYSNRLSYGLTAEKDRGEAFFRENNREGFDFYSAHFYLRNYSRTVKAVALGDYAISLGQGLILFSGFGGGKSSSPLLIKRSGRVIRPYTSVNEANFLRGAGTTLRFGRVDLSVFASAKRSDGNLIEADTLEEEDIVREFTSLRIDGLHRTPGEVADENTIRQFTTGGSLKYRGTNWHIAANALYNEFDGALATRLRPYNQFYFRGQSLLNLGIDYSFLWQNLNFFGETAMSDNGAIATLNGVLISLDRNADLSILHRHFPRDYQALNANPFAETSNARNESGIYLGLELRPVRNWILAGFFDAWKHPWVRFNADAPYNGTEYRVRLTHFKKRRYRVYLEVREEHKFINASGNDQPLNSVIPTTRFQTRLHVSNQVTKALELRSRVDFGFFKSEAKGTQRGFVALQDILFKPIDFPLHFTTRFAIFDTDGFDIRFYHFENDLLYTFSIPAYYNKGTRFYLNLRYRGIRNLTIEGRFAQTFWQNRQTIGSGLEEIDGQNRSQVGAQIKWQF